MNAELIGTASAEELAHFHRDELIEYLRANNQTPKSRKKPALVAAVLRLRGEEPPAGSEEASNEPEPTTDDEDGQAITPVEARRIDGASDQVIREFLEKRADDARPCLLEYARLVLQRREDARTKATEAEARRSDLQQYEVTKGGRVVIGGLITTLAKGSAIGPLTHDLEALERQGIEYRPVREVRTRVNQIGLCTTKFVR